MTGTPKIDAETVVDLLSLVGVSVSDDLVDSQSDADVAAAVEWAEAVHLSASDNDVRIPPAPEWLPREGEARRRG